MLRISSEIVVPLSRENEVFVEKSYRSRLTEAHVGVKCGTLGIGNVKTWHGTPDALVREASVIWKKTQYGIDDDSDDDASVMTDISDGMTTTIEAKLKIKNNMPQAIATCVVSSFTERKLHPHLQPCVPTILIDEKQFHVILYHCEKDILLVSESIDLETRKFVAECNDSSMGGT